MKKAVLSLSIAFALICVASSAAFAADMTKPGVAPPASAAKPAPPVKEMNVTFTGINEAHKMKVAGKDVTENQFKISIAKDSSGKVLPNWAGKTIRYADNPKGKELLQGHAGEQLSVTGMLNPFSRTLTVASYEKVEAKAPASPAPVAPPAK